MAETSTALSDFVLCVTSFYGAGVVYKRYIHASIGLALIGIAAGVGTIRFLNLAPINKRHSVISLHSRLAWLATILGLPLIAASFCIKFRKDGGFQLHVISGIAGILISIVVPKLRDPCTNFSSALAILSVLFHSYQYDNMFGIVGAVLYAVSVLLVGTSGYIWGMRRVDVFHYGLVLGNVAFFNALM